MSGVRLVVDSTADLGTAYLTEHKVAVVPLRVIFGEEELRDYFDITPDELYVHHEGVDFLAPRIWFRGLFLPKISVRLYDASMAEDNSAISCR